MIGLYELTRKDGKISSNSEDAKSVVSLLTNNGYTAPPENMQEFFIPCYGEPLATFVDARQWCAINVLRKEHPVRLEIAGHRVEVERTANDLVRLLRKNGFGLR